MIGRRLRTDIDAQTAAVAAKATPDLAVVVVVEGMRAAGSHYCSIPFENEKT